MTKLSFYFLVFLAFFMNGLMLCGKHLKNLRKLFIDWQHSPYCPAVGIGTCSIQLSPMITLNKPLQCKAYLEQNFKTVFKISKRLFYHFIFPNAPWSPVSRLVYLWTFVQQYKPVHYHTAANLPSCLLSATYLLTCTTAVPAVLPALEICSASGIYE